MKTLLLLLAILIVCILVLVGIGASIGLLLHSLLPAIDLGMGVLIGVIAFAFQMVIRLMMSIPAEVEDGDESAGEVRTRATSCIW